MLKKVAQVLVPILIVVLLWQKDNIYQCFFSEKEEVIKSKVLTLTKDNESIWVYCENMIFKKEDYIFGEYAPKYASFKNADSGESLTGVILPFGILPKKGDKFRIHSINKGRYVADKKDYIAIQFE